MSDAPGTEVATSPIPDELTRRDQWLLWDSRNHRPRQPHWDGDHAISWSDPADWRTFGEVVQRTDQRDEWGLGYVCAAENDDHARGIYAVIDIDNAVDDQGDPKAWVPSLAPFVDRDAYVEWSPSGTGLHIPVAGFDRPGWWSDSQIDDHEGIDVLDNKFCTFTGATLDRAGETVVDYGDWLDEWLADAYEAVVHHAKQGGWEPDPPEREPSWQELVAANSPEFDGAEEVPDDLFAQRRQRADGGAVTAESGGESAPTGGGDGGDGGGGGEDAAAPWAAVYRQYAAADNADERLPARYEAANLLADESDWRTIEENDTLWKYDPETGIYRMNGVPELRERLEAQLREQFRAHEQSEIERKIRARTTVREQQMGGPDHLICAENCVLEVYPDEISVQDHSPDHEFVGRVQTEFDPEAECPRFREFLDESVERGSDKQKLQEFAGKSTFLDTVRTMLGDDAVSSLTPQQMTSERFGGAELYGSWANIRNDIPAELIENTGQFKELVAGDPVKAEEKFKDPFMFEPTAKHMFSANELPEASTDDRAFYRRILLVAFPFETPRDERDPRLDDKLQAEHAGVLNWALDGLQRLLRNDGFTADREPWQTEQTWEKWSNSAARFAQACLEDDDEPLPTREIWETYLAYCEEEGIPSKSRQAQLTKALKLEGYEAGREYIAGERHRVILGVTLTGRGQELRDRDDDGGGQPTGLDEHR